MFKIVLSKPTFEAFDTDPDNLIFSSDYDTLKYYTLVDAPMEVDFTDYYHVEDGGFFGDIYYHRKVVEVTHNLGYVPFFHVYLVDPGSPIPAGASIHLPLVIADFLSFATIQAYADTTKIYIVYQSGLEEVDTGTANYDFVVRIFRNDLEL